MIPNKLLFLYDNDTEIRRGMSGADPIHFAASPRWLEDVQRLYGGKGETTVLISEHDPHGRRFLKYGAELVPVNGNRPQVLAQRVPNLLEYISNSPPLIFQVISRAADLAPLLEAAAAYCLVQVWVPGDAIPSAYTQAAEFARQRGQRLNIMLFKDVPFKPSQPRVRVFIDGENLLHRFRDSNARPDPTVTHRALRSIAARFGEVVSVKYLADWERSPWGESFRAGLSRCGVDTIQIASRVGKGTTDHVLVQEVMEILHLTDVLVIFTNDTDVRHLCYKARLNGVRVVCVGTHGNLTVDLQKAADEVAYLDEAIPELRPPEAKSTDEMLQKIVNWFRGNNWHFILVERLYETFGVTASDRLLLDQIIREEYLIPGSDYPETKLVFNPKKLAV